MENICCEYIDEILRFLCSSLQESLFLEFLIILISLFWILKVLVLWGKLHQNIVSHDRVYIEKIYHL